MRGNDQSIVDDDTTPSASDDTDFGNTFIDGGTVTHTFTIYNTGNADLTLSGFPIVAMSGTNASDFTVMVQPTSPVASGGGSTTFTVEFDPSSEGFREAEVSIANNDSDENPYTFAIQGKGTSPADDFVITVQTDNPGASLDTQFTIPTTGGGYNYNVDCDNDGINEAAGQTGAYTCNYVSAGTYTVRIKDNSGAGTGFPRISSIIMVITINC